MVKYKLVDTLLYQSEEGAVEGKFIIGDETLWASQKVVAGIFNTTNSNISMHFPNIVSEGELEEKEVSISSKELFADDSEFIKKSLKNLTIEVGLKYGIILTQSSQSDIESIQKRQQTFVNGLEKF